MRILTGRDPATVSEAHVISLAQAIQAAVEETALGEYDGWEIAQGKATIYSYGDDADRLFTTIEPVVHGFANKLSGVVVRRYGPPGAPEKHTGF